MPSSHFKGNVKQTTMAHNFNNNSRVAEAGKLEI